MAAFMRFSYGVVDTGALANSRKIHLPVIPVKTGIHQYPMVLDCAGVYPRKSGDVSDVF